MNILRLLAELGLNAAPFNKGMDSARNKAKSSGTEIGAAFKSAFTRFLGPAIIIAQLRSIANEIDNIEDSSQRLQLTTDQFQMLSIAADRAGQSLQGSKGIGKVFNEIAELRAKAEGGDIKASEKLKDLGLSMLGAADASETMNDAFRKVINLADSKLADVFGGRVLLDIKAFREELAKVKDEATFTPDQIASIKQADEALKSLMRVGRVGLAEAVTSPIESLKKGLDLFSGLAGGKRAAGDILQNVGGALTGAFSKAISSVFTGMISGRDPNAEARAKAIADTQQQIADLTAGAPRQQGRDLSQFIRESAGRYGLSRALIGTASQVDQVKPLNPELKKKLEMLDQHLKDLKEEAKKTIRFS